MAMFVRFLSYCIVINVQHGDVSSVQHNDNNLYDGTALLNDRFDDFDILYCKVNIITIISTPSENG